MWYIAICGIKIHKVENERNMRKKQTKKTGGRKATRNSIFFLPVYRGEEGLG